MPDQKIRFVTNLNEFPEPPKLRREPVPLPELGKDNDGNVFGVYQCELDTGEHGEFAISHQVFDELGNVVRIKQTPSRDVRLLAYTTRDPDRQRIFPTIEQAEKVLNRWGKSITNKLLLAANRVNYEEAPSADEAEKRAEGNSEQETSTTS